MYQRRSRIETVNGIFKGRGLGIMRVRSIAKVTCVVGEPIGCKPARPEPNDKSRPPVQPVRPALPHMSH